MMTIKIEDEATIMGLPYKSLPVCGQIIKVGPLQIKVDFVSQSGNARTGHLFRATIMGVISNEPEARRLLDQAFAQEKELCSQN